jgi:hypothetical protein
LNDEPWIFNKIVYWSILLKKLSSKFQTSLSQKSPQKSKYWLFKIKIPKESQLFQKIPRSPDKIPDLATLIENLKISCCHGNTWTSLRSVLAISKYFMLIRCLENIGEGLLHACISSTSYIIYCCFLLVVHFSINNNENETVLL